MQLTHYKYFVMILMGVVWMAVVEVLAEWFNRMRPQLVIPALQRSHLAKTPFASAALLASLACPSMPHAESPNTAAIATSDKALYEYVSRYPLHRGYMYCLVAIEYSGDYQSRFCPGSRIAIRLAQKALKQPALDIHDDTELRRLLIMIAKSAKENRTTQPEQGAKAPVAPSSIAHVSRVYENGSAEPTFLYCYADISYFAGPDSAYCRYTIAKLNLDLFEEGERLLPDRDAPVLFSILKSIILKEKL